MYTKEELEKLPIPELMGIANELGIKVKQDDELETVIYAILDKAAENSAAGVPAPKRKRTRIAKNDDKVYTVNGSDGENLEATPKKRTSTKKPSLDSLFAEQAPQRSPRERTQDREGFGFQWKRHMKSTKESMNPKKAPFRMRLP